MGGINWECSEGALVSKVTKLHACRVLKGSSKILLKPGRILMGV
jgi:hypothetical protein